MDNHMRPFAFKCPGCGADFIKNDYIVLHSCGAEEVHVEIVTACPSCNKRYRYLASRADLKGVDVQ